MNNPWTPVVLKWSVSLVNVAGSSVQYEGFHADVISSSVFKPEKNLCFSYPIHFRKLFLQRQYIQEVTRGYVE